MLYAVSNTLICDTIEEAKKLCYGRGSSGGSQHKVVMLDGILIHKSGFLTGGVGKYHQKARKWDDKDVVKVQQTRDQLFKEMVDLERSPHTEADQNRLRADLERLKRRLQYTEVDRKTSAD